ncbi:MAG TPA: hypothetical protein VF890_06090, partial [Gemmatimonadales bacterium]
MTRITRLVASLLLAATPAAAQSAHELPLKHAPTKTTAAITPADLMTRLYIFADDSMQGREAGLPGNVKGTNYIAAEHDRHGGVRHGHAGVGQVVDESSERRAAHGERGRRVELAGLEGNRLDV